MKGLFIPGPHRRFIMVPLNIVVGVLLVGLFVINIKMGTGGYLELGVILAGLICSITYVIWGDRRSV